MPHIAPAPDPDWITTEDGWRWMVKPSSLRCHEGEWWAAVQRQDGGQFHVALAGNTLDETDHHSAHLPTEDDARAWCLSYLAEKRAAAEEARTPRPAGGFYDSTPWKRLVRLYADGRRQCNCGDAWYNERQFCPGGCSANQLSARDEIAARMEGA